MVLLGYLGPMVVLGVPCCCSAKWRGKGKKRKGQKKKEEDDLYALLGLSNERWTASTDQIKTAYRKAALLHHPDKQVGEAGSGYLPVRLLESKSFFFEGLVAGDPAAGVLHTGRIWGMAMAAYDGSRGMMLAAWQAVTKEE